MKKLSTNQDVCLPFFSTGEKNSEKYLIGGYMIVNQLSNTQTSPANLFAEISTAYIEILAGVRRPEQLSRWLSDKAYYDISQRSMRRARQQALVGPGTRPTIILRQSKIFPTDKRRFSRRGVTRNLFCASSCFRQSRNGSRSLSDHRDSDYQP